MQSVVKIVSQVERHIPENLPSIIRLSIILLPFIAIGSHIHILVSLSVKDGALKFPDYEIKFHTLHVCLINQVSKYYNTTFLIQSHIQ